MSDIRWSGAPGPMVAALTALGHPAYADEDATPDPRVAAFGPVTTETVAGRAVTWALIRTAEGASIAPPAGVFSEPGRLHEAATGVFMSLPTRISRRQMLLELRARDMITAEEAEAAATVGAIPAKVAAVIDQMPLEQAEEARITWASMIEALRGDPLVALLQAAESLSDAWMDEFFLAASAR